MRRFLEYLSARRALIILFLFTVMIVRVLGFLADQGAEYVKYETLLISFTFVCVLLADGARWRRRRRQLRQIGLRTELVPRELPEPLDALSADYGELLCALSAQCESLRADALTESAEQREYYTLWVHQIKTPIAAMRLLLAGQDDENARLMKQELFKVEQYADLALKFVKLGDISSDLVVGLCDLDEAAQKAVKKYSLLFVYGKLSITIDPLHTEVVSDPMWLNFILEQLLSNGIKYTHAGGVHIYMENGALVVSDTGIGIRREDLPRIFEKGYTGYNGRMDNRASGIGLYLVKRASDALGIRVSVESEPGHGTRVCLRFPVRDEFMQM
jgi:signal transduction histidine kinase